MDAAKSYSDQGAHVRAGEIIKAHSENKEDIREIARGMIDRNGARSMLDLGCGYGWFEDGLERGFDVVVGVDALEENRLRFVRSAKKIAQEAAFITAVLPSLIDFPSHSFDLVVSVYSFYFFPDMLPEARRLLGDDGAFVAVTHSESMLEEGNRYFDFRNLKKIIENFSAENGEAKLRKHFNAVTAVDYPNALVFRSGEEKDLAEYIDFKREFIREDVDPDLVKETMLRELSREGLVRLNKNDRIFVART